MSKVKLTLSQLDVLSKLEEPGAKAYHVPYSGHNPNAYWFLSGDHSKCTQQVKGLLELGYLEKGGSLHIQAVITDEGRKALEE